jgi:uncharacterized membrane protein YvbJ
MYCTKCGTENPDDADICSNCGASLNSQPYKNRKNDRALEDDCFGGRGKNTWPLIVGAFMILIGVSNLFGDMFTWLNFDTLWPLFIIALGLIVVYNAMNKQKR